MGCGSSSPAAAAEPPPAQSVRASENGSVHLPGIHTDVPRLRQAPQQLGHTAPGKRQLQPPPAAETGPASAIPAPEESSADAVDVEEEGEDVDDADDGTELQGRAFGVGTTGAASRSSSLGDGEVELPLALSIVSASQPPSADGTPVATLAIPPTPIKSPLGMRRSFRQLITSATSKRRARGASAASGDPPSSPESAPNSPDAVVGLARPVQDGTTRASAVATELQAPGSPNSAAFVRQRSAKLGGSGGGTGSPPMPVVLEGGRPKGAHHRQGPSAAAVTVARATATATSADGAATVAGEPTARALHATAAANATAGPADLAHVAKAPSISLIPRMYGNAIDAPIAEGNNEASHTARGTMEHLDDETARELDCVVVQLDLAAHAGSEPSPSHSKSQPYERKRMLYVSPPMHRSALALPAASPEGHRSAAGSARMHGTAGDGSAQIEFATTQATPGRQGTVDLASPSAGTPAGAVLVTALASPSRIPRSATAMRILEDHDLHQAMVSAVRAEAHAALQDDLQDH